MSRFNVLMFLLITTILNSFTGLAFLFVPIAAILAVFILVMPASSFD